LPAAVNGALTISVALGVLSDIPNLGIDKNGVTKNLN
jgi:hypothetical protein